MQFASTTKFELLIKKGIALFIFFILFFFSTEIAYADGYVRQVKVSSGNDVDKYYITARFRDYISSAMIDLTVPYSDSYFTRDENVYYSDLAQASYGMALSAARDGLDVGATADANIKDFFDQANFTNYESTWYDRTPEGDSIATAIASKRIGDKTLIAFVCCGQGYKKEWLGNFDVGNGETHAGFTRSEIICEERLQNYIEKNEITGDTVLWVSGFSRASAVGNLLAAHMTEKGTFTKVYGYFVGTPNNTRDSIPYDNIFNIISQNDPVAQVPLTSWGYGRYGKDMFLPAQESNSEYLTAAISANEVMMSLNGQPFRNNPDLNRQLHVVFEYLADIFPTVDDYYSTLQPQLISAYEKHDSSNVLILLREALSNINNFSTEQQTAVNSFIQYLDNIIYQYVNGNEEQIKDGSWNEDARLGYNLTLEHLPINYASWIFSTDYPEELFVTSTGTERFVIEGLFNLEIWDDGGIIQAVSSSGEEELYSPGGTRPETADFVYLYASNGNGTAVVNLPIDRNFTVKLNILKDGSVSLFGNYYSYGELNNTVGKILLFQANKKDTIILDDFLSFAGLRVQSENNGKVAVIKQNLQPDTELVVERELLMTDGHSLTDILVLIAVIVLLPIMILLGILLISIFGRRIRKQYMLNTILFAVITVIYALGTVMIHIILDNIWFMSVIPSVLALLFGIICVLRVVRYARKKES